MPSLFITFRGEADVEVEIDRDYGYEPDTNAHDIDWHFVDDKFREVALTEDEEFAVFEACAQYGADLALDDHYD